MTRANVPRFFLVQFLGLWSLQLLEPSGLCTTFPPSAVRPWPDATPLLPEHHAVGLFWSSNQPVFGASRSAHFVPGRRPYQQASWLSVGHLNTGTTPAHSTHAWDLVKKQARSNTPFSGSGSTLTMTRANVPRFFLVQESLDSGSVPHDWQVGKVIPVFKKGSRASPNNPYIRRAHRISRNSHCNAVYPPQAHTVTFHQSFFLRTAQDWNDLPTEVATIIDTQAFKRLIETIPS
ncbi:uncharacterized protein LOC119403993 isoform X2 [Rhipicephalus sanguineus]|uniref:uncharacterized protein LOC119403993 isoform X2 n=1 Tax=Rhipicephalus sanguineus TaxID=34632 RepID=UPI0018943129|nr:uncharacterized protein LOC119403993 isoform X2 [Rhipicephalus sanguineus]